MARTTLTPEALFCALADETRLRILHLMEGKDVCVCYFVEVLRLKQPKVSRHLAYLRKTGLVEARRGGKWIHYRIAKLEDSRAQRILDDAMAWTRELSQAKRDLAKFKVACCQPQKFVSLEAPAPAAISH